MYPFNDPIEVKQKNSKDNFIYLRKYQWPRSSTDRIGVS